MRINAKASADLVALRVKRNTKHDGQEATVDLEIGIEKNEADNFGDGFERLAFATMREVDTTDEDGVPVRRLEHLQARIKPNRKRVIYERHVIHIDGQKITEQPELVRVITVDGSPKVVALFRVPISVTRTELITKLMAKVNGVVSVSFVHEQDDIEKDLPKQQGFQIVPKPRPEPEPDVATTEAAE